jgi:dTDP-4-dehydrorhamnose reductase
MILVVGSKGMLGTDLMRVLTGDVRGVDIDEIDITSFESARRVLLTLKPRIVVNAAAYTDVDGCETNRELAMQVNGEGVAHLALAVAEIGAKLVHISTDYVFDGTKENPWLEDDPTCPLSVYGESKFAGELNARLAPEHLIVRTQWLYGLNGKNFVETMLRLGQEKRELSVVDDQTGAPTWTVDLSQAIRALIDKGCRGTYHAANAGSCTWNGFARAIFEDAGLDVEVKPMTTAELARPATRPRYSVLDCGKLSKDTGFQLEPWRDALRKYLQLRTS